jgi:cytochrome P450
MYQGLRASNGTDNIFTTRDMDVHAKYRRLLSTGLSEGYIKKIEPTIRARADLAVHKISIELKESGVADVMKWWIFFSNDVISELTFGESFCMLEQGKVRKCRKLNTLSAV